MTHGLMVLALLAAAVMPGAGLSAEPAALDESAVKELGVKEGEPVDAGFVFFDGRYIDAPYRVSRRGRHVFINDVVVFQWDRWPLPDLRVNEDPGYPPGLTENSGLEDVIKGNSENSPWQRKSRYLYQHFPLDVARQKMADWFRRLPFVESAEFRHPGSGGLRIKMKNGEEKNVGVSPPPKESIYSWEFTNKDIIAWLERDRGRYEARLKEGDAVLSSAKESRSTWGGRRRPWIWG